MAISYSIPGAPPPIPSSTLPRPQVPLAGSGAFAKKEITQEFPRAPQTLDQAAALDASARLEAIRDTGQANTRRQEAKLLDILA